jgi:hypothetical protein
MAVALYWCEMWSLTLWEEHKLQVFREYELYREERCEISVSRRCLSMTMKSIIFWDVTPLSLVEVYQRYGGTYCLHLQGRRVCSASRQQAE